MVAKPRRDTGHVLADPCEGGPWVSVLGASFETPVIIPEPDDLLMEQNRPVLTSITTFGRFSSSSPSSVTTTTTSSSSSFGLIGQPNDVLMVPHTPASSSKSTMQHHLYTPSSSSHGSSSMANTPYSSLLPLSSDNAALRKKCTRVLMPSQSSKKNNEDADLYTERLPPTTPGSESVALSRSRRAVPRRRYDVDRLRDEDEEGTNSDGEYKDMKLVSTPTSTVSSASSMFSNTSGIVHDDAGEETETDVEDEEEEPECSKNHHRQQRFDNNKCQPAPAPRRPRTKKVMDSQQQQLPGLWDAMKNAQAQKLVAGGMDVDPATDARQYSAMRVSPVAFMFYLLCVCVLVLMLCFSGTRSSQ